METEVSVGCDEVKNDDAVVRMDVDDVTTSTVVCSSGAADTSAASTASTALTMITKPAVAATRMIVIKIVSAEYGPCEGRRRLLARTAAAANNHVVERGTINEDQTALSSLDAIAGIPLTRDVTPFLRSLLLAQQRREELQAQQQQQQLFTSNDNDHDGNAIHRETSETLPLVTAAAAISPVAAASTHTATASNNNSTTSTIRLNAVGRSRMKRTQIPVLDQNKGSMNACFGDPCPGVSKRLHISYIISEEGKSAERGATTAAAAAAAAATTTSATQQWAATAQIHRTSFAEHEKVVLRCRIGQSEQEEQVFSSIPPQNEISAVPASAPEALTEKKQQLTLQKWRLPTTVSEVVLPMTMDYLLIPERVHARLVCRDWRRVIRDWGVASIIDSNDPELQTGFTRPFLKGLLKHSYSSLQTLILSGFEDLQKTDLHPSIPFLRKLRSLDVSRCIQLDDSTLQLLASHCSETLEVLYIKGLRKVTDTGMVVLCDKCANIRVLEISNIPITDISGQAIGCRLTNLNAIYMRDNFRLTNNSINTITNNCRKLEQLTLWGCTRLRQLEFAVTSRERLVLLNLWGCHGLQDDAAAALEGMACLRSLIVSECHRLTDVFFTSLSISVPQLSHLQARYCKRISDAGVNAITRHLGNLYTFDLSFCTKISPDAVSSLLEIRGRTLAELRLYSCHNLSIGIPLDGSEPNGAHVGNVILNALRSHGDACCMSALDVRGCGGQPNNGVDEYRIDDPFVVGLTEMGFQQRVPGYFVRSARWNTQIEQRLIRQFMKDKRHAYQE